MDATTAEEAAPLPPASAGPADVAPALEDQEDDTTNAYVARGLGVADVLAADAADDALTRYKKTLLGSCYSAESDEETRRVVVREVRLIVAGRPDIVIDVSNPDAVASSAANRYVFKEGATYELAIACSVHHEVVLGLRWTQAVSRLGLVVDRDAVVLGAYAPRGAAEPYTYRLPAAEWPSGMLARGQYRCVAALCAAASIAHGKSRLDYLRSACGTRGPRDYDSNLPTHAESPASLAVLQCGHDSIRRRQAHLSQLQIQLSNCARMVGEVT